MTLAGEYAYAGREWVVERVRNLIGGAIVDEVHNHHNYAWRERHDDRELWVVRKGATPAFPGQRGFVGGYEMETLSIGLPFMAAFLNPGAWGRSFTSAMEGYSRARSGDRQEDAPARPRAP